MVKFSTLKIIQLSSVGDLLCEDLEDLDLGMGERGTGVSESGIMKNPLKKTTAGTPMPLEIAKVMIS